jgi:hypothetical protein
VPRSGPTLNVAPNWSRYATGMSTLSIIAPYRKPRQAIMRFVLSYRIAVAVILLIPII